MFGDRVDTMIGVESLYRDNAQKTANDSNGDRCNDYEMIVQYLKIVSGRYYSTISMSTVESCEFD